MCELVDDRSPSHLKVSELISRFAPALVAAAGVQLVREGVQVATGRLLSFEELWTESHRRGESAASWSKVGDDQGTSSRCRYR